MVRVAVLGAIFGGIGVVAGISHGGFDSTLTGIMGYVTEVISASLFFVFIVWIFRTLSRRT
jgi:hypothetical protein